MSINGGGVTRISVSLPEPLSRQLDELVRQGTVPRPVAPVLAAVQLAGGEVVEGPAPAPNGARLIARHPDGAVFEYIETGEAG